MRYQEATRVQRAIERGLLTQYNQHPECSNCGVGRDAKGWYVGAYVQVRSQLPDNRAGLTQDVHMYASYARGERVVFEHICKLVDARSRQGKQPPLPFAEQEATAHGQGQVQGQAC